MIQKLFNFCLVTIGISYGYSANMEADLPPPQKNFPVFHDPRISAVLEQFPPAVTAHTKYGVGLRTPYPQSDATDALKARVEPVPYNPVSFTAPSVFANTWSLQNSAGWADPESPNDITEQIKAGRVRVIEYGYSVDGTKYNTVDGLPQNPMGLTGIQGRGELGLWGPQPAADPITKRRAADGVSVEVLLVIRRDNLQWAIPGGMRDPADARVSETLKRELGEETSLDYKSLEQQGLLVFLDNVYCGYVDDPRNTDNAWMETIAGLFWLEDGAPSKVQGGDDAIFAKWIKITPELLAEGKVDHGLSQAQIESIIAAAKFKGDAANINNLFASHPVLLRDSCRKIFK